MRYSPQDFTKSKVLNNLLRDTLRSRQCVQRLGEHIEQEVVKT